MLSIISPAKKLLSELPVPHKNSSTISFKKQTLELAQQLKDMTVAEISTLMGLSENLSRLNFERYQDFNLKGTKQQPSANAIYLFQGDVYQSLDAKSLNDDAIKFSQSHLSILSGLYGLIKPLDLIQPYRLEMGTKLANSQGKNLYDFWQETLTKDINEKLSTHKNKLLINLASSEYSKAINQKALNYPMITIHFKENKNGKLKTIGIHAKKARGAFARYIIENQIDDFNQLLEFDALDYHYQAPLSDEKNLVFIR